MPAGRRFSGRSRWWPAPIPLDVLLGLASYRSFCERFPWAVEPAPGAAVTTEALFGEAVRRLGRYRTMLRDVGRPRVLGPGVNPYLDLVGLLAEPFPDDAEGGEGGEGASAWSVAPGLGQLLDLPGRRRELVDRFAWAIPSGGGLDAVARHGPIVEGGAGRGYWAGLLRARGVDIVAYDRAPPGSPNVYHPGRGGAWTGVAVGTSIEAVRRHPDRTLFLCWPPHDDDAAGHGALRAYRGEVLVYVGEGRDGASGTVRFQRELERNWSVIDIVGVPQWPGLGDRLVVYRRNALRRRLIERDRCFECRRFIRTGSIGRCERCFALRPPALALAVDGHRVEYPAAEVVAMPPAVRRAIEMSPNRIV